MCAVMREDENLCLEIKEKFDKDYEGLTQTFLAFKEKQSEDNLSKLNEFEITVNRVMSQLKSAMDAGDLDSARFEDV